MERCASPAQCELGRLKLQRPHPPGRPGSSPKANGQGGAHSGILPLRRVFPRDLESPVLESLMVTTPQEASGEGKRSLRHVLRERRSLLRPEQRQSRGRRASKRLGACLQVHGVRRVGLFASIRCEIPTEPAFEVLREQGCEVALPRILEDSEILEFGWVQDWTNLVFGRYHIPEPVGEVAELRHLDAIVVPGLGFDASGGRLGYGAGWYDRTLASYAGWVVGFGFDVQVVEAVPMEPHDRRLDFVVTDERTLATRAR